MRYIVLVIFLGLLANPVQAEDCEWRYRVFESGPETARRVLHFDDNGTTSRHNVFIDQYEGDRLVARMYGNWISSLGAVRYFLQILKAPVALDLEEDISDEQVLLTVEVEIVAAAGEPTLLVLTGLQQQLSRYGTEHIEFLAEPADRAAVMAGPNAFSYAECRAPEVIAKPVPRPITCPWSSGDVYRGDDVSFGISSCSIDSARAYFALSCGDKDGGILIQYELAGDTGGPVSEGGAIDVGFETEAGRWELVMRGNDMDGTHEAQIGRGHPLLASLAASSTLTISDENGVHPVRKLSLQGSREAIDTLLRACAQRPN